MSFDRRIEAILADHPSPATIGYKIEKFFTNPDYLLNASGPPPYDWDALELPSTS